jgi:hypothetical protein
MSEVRSNPPNGSCGGHDDRDIVITTPEHFEAMTEAWRRVWRQGLVPQLTRLGLEGLEKALDKDLPTLMTGATSFPPPLACMENEPVEKCCPLCFALLDGNRPEYVSVGPLETRFAEACWGADERTGMPGGIKYFLNFVDMEPWEKVRRELLAEVRLALRERERGLTEEPMSPLARMLKASLTKEGARS